MDYRDEGELIDNHNNIVGFAMEAGIPLDIDVGINRAILADMIARNGGCLFLDDNFKIGDGVTFAIYDVRYISNARKRLINSLYKVMWGMVAWIAMVLFAGVVTGLVSLFKNERDPFINVLFINDTFMSVWILPIWFVFINIALYISIKSLVDRLFRESDTGEKVAEVLKKCWKGRVG